jgi:hypothetical protein
MPDSTILVSVSSSSQQMEGTVYSGETLIPGEIVHLHANGSYSNQFPSGTWVGTAPSLVVVENLDQGKDINSTYSAGETVFVRYLRSGDVFLGWLESGNDALISSLLSIGEEGQATVIFALSSPYYFGTAIEAVDALSSKKRIKIQIK